MHISVYVCAIRREKGEACERGRERDLKEKKEKKKKKRVKEEEREAEDRSGARPLFVSAEPQTFRHWAGRSGSGGGASLVSGHTGTRVSQTAVALWRPVPSPFNRLE